MRHRSRFLLIFLILLHGEANDTVLSNPGKSNPVKYLEQTLIAKLFGGQGIVLDPVTGNEEQQTFTVVYNKDVRPFDVGQAKFKTDNDYTDIATFITEVCDDFETWVKTYMVNSLGWFI